MTFLTVESRGALRLWMILLAITFTTITATSINTQQSSNSPAKRRARWTFQNLQEDVPVNGTDALQYDPITEEQLRNARPTEDPEDASKKFPPMTDLRPDKVLKSTADATVVMTKLSNLKKDFCKSETFVQRIKEPGCVGRNVVNRYCYGQCNSFYIPEGQKRKRGRANSRRNHKLRSSSAASTPFPDYLEDEDLTAPAFKSCPTCRPTSLVWITVKLRCPKLSPPYRKKRIQKIQQCKCMEESMVGGSN